MPKFREETEKHLRKENVSDEYVITTSRDLIGSTLFYAANHGHTTLHDIRQKLLDAGEDFTQSELQTCLKASSTLARQALDVANEMGIKLTVSEKMLYENFSDSLRRSDNYFNVADNMFLSPYWNSPQMQIERGKVWHGLIGTYEDGIGRCYHNLECNIRQSAPLTQDEIETIAWKAKAIEQLKAKEEIDRIEHLTKYADKPPPKHPHDFLSSARKKLNFAGGTLATVGTIGLATHPHLMAAAAATAVVGTGATIVANNAIKLQEARSRGYNSFNAADGTQVLKEAYNQYCVWLAGLGKGEEANRKRKELDQVLAYIEESKLKAPDELDVSVEKLTPQQSLGSLLSQLRDLRSEQRTEIDKLNARAFQAAAIADSDERGKAFDEVSKDAAIVDFTKTPPEALHDLLRGIQDYQNTFRTAIGHRMQELERKILQHDLTKVGEDTRQLFTPAMNELYELQTNGQIGGQQPQSVNVRH